MGTPVHRRDQGRARSADDAGTRKSRRRISSTWPVSSTPTSSVTETCRDPQPRYGFGRIKVLKQHFGHLPVKALEEPAVVNRFKTESEYARRVEIATLHKVLAILRAAIRWGQAQTPPLIDKSPFHRFGVRLNRKAETVRDRRISRDEEKRLLDAALAMNTWEHRWSGR